MRVIDNFLDLDSFDKVRNLLLGESFPWFFNPYIVDYGEKSGEDLRVFFFTHVFIRDGLPNSNLCSALSPLIEKLDPACINRCQANLNVFSGTTPLEVDYHTDVNFDFPLLTGIYYVNTNNGYTEFESGDKVESKENRLCIFSHKLRHRPVLQTDTKHRVLINFVFAPKTRNDLPGLYYC